MSTFKFKSTDLDDYFESGSSTIGNIANKFNGFPSFSTASLDYEKITDSFGYIYNGQDLKDLYSIKSKSVQYTSGSGPVAIPTWANAIKVRIDTKQGAQGAGLALNPDGQVGRFPDGTPGVSYDSADDGTPGTPGNPGAPNQVHNCPTGSVLPPYHENRTKSGGAGGTGGPGGTGGRATSGGAGGQGGLGALGGVGGYGKTYYSRTISNLDDIRGNGSITYNISESGCQISGTNFGLTANIGGTGNAAQGGNNGQPGQDANQSQAGQPGGDGTVGGDGGGDCESPGTGSQGCAGGWGCPGAPGDDGSDGSDGSDGDSGDDATPGQRGIAGTVTETGDFQNSGESLTDVDNTSNRIIVHYFLH